MSWRRDHHRAFTLFEVMLSLLIIVVAVLASVALLPAGLDAQTRVRQQLLASTMALTVMDNFHNPTATVHATGDDPVVVWDRPVSGGGPAAVQGTWSFANRLRRRALFNSAFAPDLEKQVADYRFGVIPVPPEIARRLDSEGDEIRSILDQGGALFYLDPLAIRGIAEGSHWTNEHWAQPDPEIHKIVFAVRGAPQQNALFHNPWEPWPWHAHHPHPPVYRGSALIDERDLVDIVPPIKGTAMSGKKNAWLSKGPSGFVKYAGFRWVGDGEGVPGRGYHGRIWHYFGSGAYTGGEVHDPAQRWVSGYPRFAELAMELDQGWSAVAAALAAAPTYGVAVADPDVTLAPNSEVRNAASYAMRAGYRDRAIALWNAVNTNDPPTGFVPMAATTSITPDDYTRQLGAYIVGPEQLERFDFIDPYGLPAGQYPPHPAQVLALGYLAHAAMMVTGFAPPWASDEYSVHGGHLQAPNALDPIGLPDRLVGGARVRPFQRFADLGEKDCQLLVADALVGATTVEIANGYDGGGHSTEPVVFYQGDWVWFEGDPEHVYEVAADLTMPDGSVATPLQLGEAFEVRPRRFEPTGQTGLRREIRVQTGGAFDKGSPCRFTRVASAADRAFARRVYEMSTAWLMAATAENPYDWALPRPIGRQLFTDRTLCLFDLFYDAGPGANDGYATRSVHHRPGDERYSGGALAPAGGYSQYTDESFHRWVVPRNPITGRHAVSHLWPFQNEAQAVADYDFSSWDAIQANAQLDQPSVGSDAERYWLNRPFDPGHRTRQLVFWSVDWKAYEDAERVPSAPLDMARHGLGVGGRQWLDSFSSDISGRDMSSGDGGLGNGLIGHPETMYAWYDEQRDTTAIKERGDEVISRHDVKYGKWGADRNFNFTYDQGPVPASTRMRATTLLRLNYYDPVMRVHVGN